MATITAMMATAIPIVVTREKTLSPGAGKPHLMQRIPFVTSDEHAAQRSVFGPGGGKGRDPVVHE